MSERKNNSKELAVFIASLTLAGCARPEERKQFELHADNNIRTEVPALTQTPSSDATSTPTSTSTPTLTPTPIPDFRATQGAQWVDLENAERKEEVELINARITRILFAGGSYWVEANIEEEEGITLLQSDCIKDALEESGELGRQVETGIYEPGAQIDLIRGNVKLPSDIAGALLEASGIKIPIVDLAEIENDGKLYSCDVVTADEAARRSLKETYDKLRPILERAYPRMEQIGGILGNLLDLAEQEAESLLDSTPSP